MKFKVYTIPHTLFAAAHLVDQLKELGHEAELIGKLDVKDTTIHIIYNPAVLRALPPRYIVYQTEIGTSKWFSNNYLKMISGAIAVWDYSRANVLRYDSYNNHISIVTPGIAPQEQQEKDIPVTFYGWITGSERRGKLLSSIGRQIPLNIVTNTLGNSMWEILRRTKVVLNIHFYQNSPMEIFRINEALSFGCHVVSEPPAMDNYRELVQFASGAEMLALKVKDCLKTDFDLPVEKLDNKEEIRKAIAAMPQSLSSASPIRKSIILNM